MVVNSCRNGHECRNSSPLMNPCVMQDHVTIKRQLFTLENLLQVYISLPSFSWGGHKLLNLLILDVNESHC